MYDDRCETRPDDEAWEQQTRPPTRVAFSTSFEGRSLACLEVDGLPCWFACEVAGILGLGLERGASELARRMAIDWIDVARPGEHWICLGELELADIRATLEDQGMVLPRALTEACGTLVLLEPGVALAVERMMVGDDSPGPRLLDHLRRRVAPAIAARGREPGTRHVGTSALEREAAAIRRERLALERSRWEYDALEGLCDALQDGGEVDPDVVWAYRVVAAETALGAHLWPLKPGIEHGWLRPSEIAERHLGVTRQRVGQVISLLGLRDSEVHSKAVLNKAVGRDRTVITHLYSPAAVGLIERELESRGYRRVE